MNIANLFPIQTELAILFPGGADTGIKVQLVGLDSSKFRQAAHRWSVQLQGSDEPLTTEQIEAKNTDLLATCIVGWTGLEDDSGPIAYSHDKAVELLSTEELSFIREQVDRHLGQRAKFFRTGKDTA